ncbi:hypothetical protein MG293_002176 [Ovis ammon polii]|uniref:Uncharacterized protein n=1 Tax=Ovis ammon polii TaxID=230172 RepID=A0AAD4UP98_OVIAM|nr:hypothetical protein MG293_002176 [Ovis ammon polii]
MSVSDRLPDYPVNSDFVKKLKSALEGRDEARLRDLICADVRHVDAVIELANDDWMKDPSAQLPPGVLAAKARRCEEQRGQSICSRNSSLPDDPCDLASTLG